MSDELDVEEDLHGLDVVLPVARDRSVPILATIVATGVALFALLSDPSPGTAILVAAVCAVAWLFADRRRAALSIDHEYLRIGRSELGRHVEHRFALHELEVMERDEALQFDAAGQRLLLTGLSPEHRAWIRERVGLAMARSGPPRQMPPPPEALHRLRSRPGHEGEQA